MKKSNFVIKEVDHDFVITHSEEEWKDFSAKFCPSCKATNGFNVRYFLLNRGPKTVSDEEDLRETMKNNFSITAYGTLSTGKSFFLVVAKCTKCNSEDVIMDF